MAQSLGGSGDASWEKLLGSDHWAGLLHPLDQSLRLFLLKLGDLLTIATDAYITDEQSKMYAGSCRYGTDSLFRNTSFPFAADYSVDGFLYFNAQSFFLGRDDHWNGYVAVSTDDHAKSTGRREIYVLLRGTEGLKEAFNDLHLLPVEFDPAGEGVKVMASWYEFYTTKVRAKSLGLSLREQLHAKIKELVRKHKDEELSIVCVGHSMGGALAILSAYDIVNSELSDVGGGRHFPVTAVTFESPRVGNSAFDGRLKKLPNLRVLRVTNSGDDVPKLPAGFDYVDNGEVLEVDSKRSNYLKAGHSAHNLEVVLHTVSGWEGGFLWLFDVGKGGRDPAMVNKHSDILVEERKVPSTWWVEKNKAMVRGDDGTWRETAPEDKTLIDT